MSEEPTAFIDYWKPLTPRLLKFSASDTGEAGIDAGPYRQRSRAGWTRKNSPAGGRNEYGLEMIVSYDTIDKQSEGDAMKKPADAKEAITPAEYRAFQEAYDFLQRGTVRRFPAPCAGDVAAPRQGARLFLARSGLPGASRKPPRMNWR